MPVFIYDNDAFEKLVEVEGGLYRRHGQREMMAQCSYAAFKEAWEEGFARWKGTAQEYPNVTVEGGAAIYGFGGYNKYAVQANGEMIFLPGLAGTSEAIQQAQAAGFTLDRAFPGSTQQSRTA